MEHNKNFIRKALHDIKPILQKIGYHKIKVKDILLGSGFSKSKFFQYFGTKVGLLELVLYDEFRQCYLTIDNKINHIENMDQMVNQTMSLRKKYIRENPILNQYFENLKQSPSAMNKLKTSADKIETDFLNTILKRYI